jgi:alanyl-tRNA synthetase
MTTRLYYHDSFLYDFEAEVREVQEGPKPALLLDRTAFYPTSGGQVFDTGVISTDNEKLKVSEVVDTEDGRVVHYLEAPPKSLQPGSKVRGQIDATRRRDHMQQHTGQHVLSAAFVRLFNIPTVSTWQTTTAPSTSTRRRLPKIKSKPPNVSPTKSSSRTEQSISASSLAKKQGS